MWRGLQGEMKELILVINDAPHAEDLDPVAIRFGFSANSDMHLDNIRYHSPANLRSFLKLQFASPAVDTGFTPSQTGYFFHDFDDKVGPIDSFVEDPNEETNSDRGANEYPFVEETAYWWERFWDKSI